MKLHEIFGSWQVVDTPENVMVLCRCICGVEKLIKRYNLISGYSTQCQKCATISRTSARRLLCSHMSNRLYKRLQWKVHNAISRCTNVDDKDYACYGGRGISVCPEWVLDQGQFIIYLAQLPGVDVSGLVLDRENNDGNYEPDNLRFVTWYESAQNRANPGPRKVVR